MNLVVNRTRLVMLTDDEAAELYQFTKHMYIGPSYQALARLLDRVTTHIETVRPELLETR